MEKDYGRRRLFVRQGGNLIYSRRLTPEQSLLIETAIKSLGLPISMDDSTVCPILLGCVSSSVSPDGKRNQVNAPLTRTSFDKDGFVLKNKLNELASNLIQLNGFDVDSEHDFSMDKIGPGNVAWNQACVAWAILHDDKAVLKFQN